MPTTSSPTPACITIGNFDGVHLGHQSLIQLAKRTAQLGNLNFTLMTFWPHPRSVLQGPQAHMPLCSREEKMRFLQEQGVANVLELPFTPELASLSPRQFIEKHLLPLNLKELVIGHDFTLGRGREGNAEVLAQMGHEYGFNVRQAPAFSIAGSPVSSTRLRQEIRQGKIGEAAKMLGRFHSVQGKVGRGHGRGAGLGFPTANLVNADALLPGNGVYATFALSEGKRFQAVTNIGYNPTFNNNYLTVESFLLDAKKDLYDQDLRLEFVDLLRHERKFDSPAQLGAQIGKDVEKARAILSSAYPDDA